MNIEQTRQLLSFLWSKFPNSRILSVEDKQMTVLAYFDELWQYSLQDALNAARCALREQPHFVPSAPEIAHYAHKTFDPTAFLSPEYAKLQAQIDQLNRKVVESESDYDASFRERVKLTRNRLECQMTPDEKSKLERLTAIIEEFLDLKDECRRLEEKKAALYADAVDTAANFYNAAESALANQDFKQLGWIERRTAITEA